MTNEQSLIRTEATELAYWLTPLPELQLESYALYRAGAGDKSHELGTIRQFAPDSATPLPDLGPLKKFGSWASVAATIDRKAIQLSGYNPAATEFDEVKWEAYKQKLSTAPFWTTKTTRLRQAEIASLSLKGAVDAVEDIAVAFVSAGSIGAIIEGIKKIGQLAVENEGKTNKESFQEQGVTSEKNGLLYVGQIRTSVEMTYKSGKGYQQSRQSLIINSFHAVLDFDKCKRSAATLLDWDFNDIEEWENSGNSQHQQPNNSPAWNI